MILSWHDAEKPDGMELSGPFEVSTKWIGRRDVERIEGLDLSIHAVASKGLCHVDGHGDGFVVYQCVRCLTDVREPLHITLHEVFSQSPVTTDQDNDGVVYQPDDKILLDSYIVSSVILELKGQPLCSESCAGLCPVCGKNLNNEDCHCQDRVIDPRLEVLSELKQQLADSDES